MIKLDTKNIYNEKRSATLRTQRLPRFGQIKTLGAPPYGNEIFRAF